MVSGNLDFVRDHESGAVVFGAGAAPPYRQGAFARGWMAAHPTFYVRRHVVDAVGRFDLSYSIAADYDFMLRAYEIHGFQSHHVDEVLVDMQAGGRSTAGLQAYLRSNREALCARRHWLGSGVVDYALLAKPLGKLNQFFVGKGRAVGSNPGNGSSAFEERRA